MTYLDEDLSFMMVDHHYAPGSGDERRLLMRFEGDRPSAIDGSTGLVVEVRVVPRPRVPVPTGTAPQLTLGADGSLEGDYEDTGFVRISLVSGDENQVVFDSSLPGPESDLSGRISPLSLGEVWEGFLTLEIGGRTLRGQISELPYCD